MGEYRPLPWVKSLGYVYDVGLLDWIPDEGGGGGGGGAVTIADGADVAEGATTDAAVITDTTGTVSGKLRGLVKWAFERMPAALGQTTMAASLPVTLASNQSALAVTGPLTDAQLRATPVPISATDLDIRDLAFATDKVDVSGSTGVGVTGPQTDTEDRAYQTATGTITAAAQNVTLALNGATGASVNFIDSSFDGTFKFYSSVDGGATYVETQAFNVYGATGGTEISNAFHTSGILGFRIWNFVLVGGETHVRVQAETGSSGSTAVVIKANNGAPSPTALAIGPSDSDTGRPVGSVMVMGRYGTAGTRTLRSTPNRYEGNVSAAVVLSRVETTNNLATDTTVNDTAVSTLLLAQNVNRFQAVITNTSSAVLYTKLGTSAASATSYTKRLAQYETWFVPEYWIGQINGIWASDPNDGVAIVQELVVA